jgi:hypothetical protein
MPAAKKKTFDDLDDDARFSVDLKGPVKIGRTWARPGQAVEMKGRLVKEHAANVADVRPIAD